MTDQRDILVVSRVFPPEAGGIQEYVYNRCLQEPERVVVLTAAYPGDQAFDEVQPFAVERWPFSEPWRALLKSLGPLGAVLKQGLYLVWEVLGVLRLCRRYRFRAIEWAHAYDFPALGILSVLVSVPFFLYAHGDDVLCPRRTWIAKGLFEWVLGRVKAVACNSNFTRDFLQKNFVCATPMLVLNPTVRPAKFGQALDLEPLRAQVRTTHHLPAEAVVILSVGRLVRRKGFDRVIRNLPGLVKAGVPVYYLVAGKGAMEDELRVLACQMGVRERVIFAGYVPDAHLAGYYAACDLFALPTYFERQSQSIEGFGIVYREAGYFGKPVLASRVGGATDAVHNWENGLLVDPEQPEELALALQRLCTDPKLRAELGARGRELALVQTPHQVLYEQIS
ncbi:glycosyltransferase family 4 protein [Anthocerotibacter panamensis]|uniref:glycosyltransferase family 4 protein n=1 Tax=Anthocerotibacter panamensis TaxID=2857077 RepID=UPI001C40267D|nr:glycosyltransferase family 4 protein [Anthocerotibacter panamensis]